MSATDPVLQFELRVAGIFTATPSRHIDICLMQHRAGRPFTSSLLGNMHPQKPAAARKEKGSLQKDGVVECVNVAATSVLWAVENCVPAEAVPAEVCCVQNGTARAISVLFQEKLCYFLKLTARSLDIAVQLRQVRALRRSCGHFAFVSIGFFFFLDGYFFSVQ